MTMTAKHIDEIETVVVECVDVIARKANSLERHVAEVTVTEIGGAQRHFHTGTVYLMNSAGNTVSQWFLSGTGNGAMAATVRELAGVAQR